MSAGEADRTARSNDSSEPTAVLPEAAAELVKLEQLQQALSQAEERARSLHDQYVRTLAEIENVRKRAQRDVESASRYGLEKFAVELLPVKDSLQLGVENAPRADTRSLAEGQEATLKLLNKAFEKLGINELNPLGQPFDPTHHEALTAQESATAEPNSVLQVVQRGYELNGRLLRPARVIVAKSPEQNTSGRA
jgi:molecular chaperone GrpE